MKKTVNLKIIEFSILKYSEYKILNNFFCKLKKNDIQTFIFVL
jgi:hypothetical protein